MNNELLCTILCPSRIELDRRYGTCERLILGEDIAYLNLLSTILPQTIAQQLVQSRIYIVILGNVEGVMDVFERGESTDTALQEWLHFNNVFQTFQLLKHGLKEQGLSLNSKHPFNITGLNPLADNCYFISARDFVLDDTLQAFLPDEIGSISEFTALVDWYTDHIDYEKHGDLLDTCTRTLREKCPALTPYEIDGQVKKIRYAHRRASGLLIELLTNYFEASDSRLISSLPPEVMDQFHTTHDGALISTDHLGWNKDAATCPDLHLLLTSLLSIRIPFPVTGRSFIEKTIPKTLNLQPFRVPTNVQSVAPEQTRKGLTVLLDLRGGLFFSDYTFLQQVKSHLANGVEQLHFIIKTPNSDLMVISNVENSAYDNDAAEGLTTPICNLLTHIFDISDLYVTSNYDDLLYRDATMLNTRMVMHLSKYLKHWRNNLKDVMDFIADLKIYLLLEQHLSDDIYISGFSRAFRNLLNENTNGNRFIEKRHPSSSSIILDDLYEDQSDVVFQSLMHSRDSDIFPLFAIPESQYSLDKKLICARDLTSMLFSHDIAEQTRERFVVANITT